MKQLVATLRFYVDEERMNESSSSMRVGENDYEIVVRPNADKLGFADISSNISPAVLTHELGHFISYIAREPHNFRMYKLLYGETPSEIAAWERAEEILREVRNRALAEYQREDQKNLYGGQINA